MLFSEITPLPSLRDSLTAPARCMLAPPDAQRWVCWFCGGPLWLAWIGYRAYYFPLFHTTLAVSSREASPVGCAPDEPNNNNNYYYCYYYYFYYNYHYYDYYDDYDYYYDDDDDDDY